MLSADALSITGRTAPVCVQGGGGGGRGGVGGGGRPR